MKIGSNNPKDFQKEKKKNLYRGHYKSNRISISTQLHAGQLLLYISNSMGDKWVKKKEELEVSDMDETPGQ